MFFLIGGLIGLSSAVIGALVQYWISRKGTETSPNELPGCIYLVIGALGFTGVVATIFSLLWTGGVRTALVIGAGVFLGFFAGFMVMFVLWIVVDSFL